MYPDAVTLLDFAQVNAGKAHHLVITSEENKLLALNLIAGNITFQRLHELLLHLHVLTEAFGSTLELKGHIVLLVGRVGAEEGVASEVTLNVPISIEREERPQCEVRTDVLSIHLHEVPLRPDERIVSVANTFLGSFAATAGQN